jgi:hypothetical protein
MCKALYQPANDWRHQADTAQLNGFTFFELHLRGGFRTATGAPRCLSP